MEELFTPDAYDTHYPSEVNDMLQDNDDPKIAGILFKTTIILSMAGIAISIFFYFVDDELAFRTAAAILVGLVGIISFIRHSVYFRSDQARMGWHQEHPEFQLEVGYANLAIGIVALLAAGLNWGSLAYGMTLLTYGLYLLCALLLHGYEAFHVTQLRKRAMKSVMNTGIFVVFLFIFAFFAISHSYTGV